MRLMNYYFFFYMLRITSYILYFSITYKRKDIFMFENVQKSYIKTE